MGIIVASSNNRAILFSRVVGFAIIGVVGAVFATIPYCILMVLFYFNVTETCGYKCSDYFEQLSKEGPVKIYGEESTGHLFIRGNDDARQIEIYTPSKTAKEVSVSSNGELKTTKTYSKVRTKAKEVRFSDFKQIDPVLSSFQDLQEPDVPQKVCPINNVHDMIDMRVE